MALPILPALMRGLAVTKIADKLIPKNADQLETSVNVVKSIKPKEQENRSLVPAEGISEDKMTILPPEKDKEKSIEESMDVFRQILDNLIMIKENVLGIKTGLSEDRKLEMQKEKILAGQSLESKVESERLTEDAGEEQKISIVQAAKKGLGLIGKLILGIFAFDVIRKLFKEFAPDLYGKIETGLKDMAKGFEESFLGGLAIDTIKNSANAIYKGILGTYNLVIGLISGDLEQAAKGADQFNESVMSALDNFLNPILAILEIGMRDSPDYERTKNVFQEGYKNYKALVADIENFFREFEIKPEVLEAISFDNIKKEIKKLGNELVDNFRQLFVDLKNFFTFGNLKRIITGEEKPIEQQINEIKASDGKFVKKQQQEIIDQMTDQGKLEKESKRKLLGLGNLEYNDLTAQEKEVVDAEVKRRQDIELNRLDPEGFQQRKLQDEKMDAIRENMDNLDAVPEKDPDKISMGSSMRNYAMDPKPMAMVARTTNAPTNVDNRSSSSVVSTTFNTKKGGGGGFIETRNRETSLYAGLVPSFMQGTRS